MALRFEKFTHVGSRYNQRISIRSNGTIGLSQGVIERYKLGIEKKGVVLFYDRANQVVGIQPIEAVEGEGAISVCLRTTQGERGKKSHTAFVSAKSFLDYYGISYRKTQAFPAEWDADHEMIVVQLAGDEGGVDTER